MKIEDPFENAWYDEDLGVWFHPDPTRTIEELRTEEGIYSVLVSAEVSMAVHAANEKEAEDHALQICNATLVGYLRSMRVVECTALTSDNKLGES